MKPYLLRMMEDLDSDNSRDSIITVESNASDDVIITSQDFPPIEVEPDVILMQSENPGSSNGVPHENRGSADVMQNENPGSSNGVPHENRGSADVMQSGVLIENPGSSVGVLIENPGSSVGVQNENPGSSFGMQDENPDSQPEPQATTSGVQSTSSTGSAERVVTVELVQDAPPAHEHIAEPIRLGFGNVRLESEDFVNERNLNAPIEDESSVESEEDQEFPQSSAGIQHPPQPIDDVAMSSTPPSLLPAIKEFISGTSELTRLDCLTTESLSKKLSDSNILGILKSLHKSLGAITGNTAANEQKSSSSPSRQRKRKQSEKDDSPTAKKTKLETEKSEKDVEENSCSICLEPWSTGGEHRITSLKCGHLFGLSCITRWVNQDKSCPQCKAKSKKSEFRGLFVKNIMAEDTSQRDRAMLLLDLEKDKVREQERCEANLRRKVETQAQDLELIRLELARCKTQLASDTGMRRPIATDPQTSQPSEGSSQTTGVTGSSSSSSSGPSTSQSSNLKKFHTFQRIYISQEGQCRVFDFSKDLGMTVVSQKSSNPLFRGYGIKMLARDFRPLSYQPLHSAAIRDLSFRPGTLDGMLLTCGLDKTVLLSSVNSRAVVQKYTLNSTVWCCAWNTHDTNVFYAGMERGVVREFDIRRTNAHVRDVLDSGGSPISNIQFWRGSDAQGNFFQGLLIAQIQNLIFKQQVRNNFTHYVLPQMKAPVMSLCLHPSGKFLSSFRPGLNIPKCRYEVSDIRMTDEEQQKIVTSRLHAMFDGGNMQAVISRNCLLSRPETEDGLLAVTANHPNNTVNLWDFDQRSNFQTLPCYEKAIDIKPIVPCNATGNFLGVLTDKDLVLYKWRE